MDHRRADATGRPRPDDRAPWPSPRPSSGRSARSPAFGPDPRPFGSTRRARRTRRPPGRTRARPAGGARAASPGSSCPHAASGRPGRSCRSGCPRASSGSRCGGSSAHPSARRRARRRSRPPPRTSPARRTASPSLVAGQCRLARPACAPTPDRPSWCRPPCSSSPSSHRSR